MPHDQRRHEFASANDVAQRDSERANRTCEVEHDDTGKAAREADQIRTMWAECYADTPCGHYLLDAAGTVIESNNTGLTLLGYAREEIVGSRQLADMMSPASAALLRQNLARLPNPWPSNGECEIQRTDGTRRSVLTWGTPIKSKGGQCRRSRVSVFDVSERNVAQEKLEKSERRNAAILRNALDCVVTIDSAGRVMEFNPAAERTFGYSREQAIGKDVASLIIPPAMRDAHCAGLLRYVQTRRPVLSNRRVQVTAMRSDGTQFPVELTITPIELQDEVVFTAYLRDVSRERWAEQELRRYPDELRAMSRRLVAVQEVERCALASALHDLVGQKLTALNIDLNIVKGRLPAGGDPILNARLNESLGLVEETIESIRDVMGALRPAVLDDYGLGPGLHWYGELFRKQTGLATSVVQEGPIPRMPMQIEETFFRIAQEALANVVKYAKARKVTVTLSPASRGTCLKIADDGCGFDTTVAQKPTRDGGWGLMIMRERAAGIGARMRVESTPGGGTTVFVEWHDT